MSPGKAILASKPIILPFVAGLSVYTVIGIAVYFCFGKEQAHLFLNAWHSPYSDLFFKYMTHIGNGTVLVLLFLFLLTVRFSWALGLGVSGMVTGVVVQILKQSVFAGDHRPAMFFPEGGLPRIDGVELMLNNSFPSGHSAAVFCVCLMLAFFVKQRWATYFFLSVALLTAFSRVYISQHFIQDTVAGAWIGLVAAWTGYLFIVHYAEEHPASKLNGRLWP